MGEKMILWGPVVLFGVILLVLTVKAFRTGTKGVKIGACVLDAVYIGALLLGTGVLEGILPAGHNYATILIVLPLIGILLAAFVDGGPAVRAFFGVVAEIALAAVLYNKLPICIAASIVAALFILVMIVRAEKVKSLQESDEDAAKRRRTLPLMLSVLLLVLLGPMLFIAFMSAEGLYNINVDRVMVVFVLVCLLIVGYAVGLVIVNAVWNKDEGAVLDRGASTVLGDQDAERALYDNESKVTELVSFLVTKVNEIRSIGRVLQVNCYPDKIVIEYSTDDSGEKAKFVYFDKEYCALDIDSLRQYFVYLNKKFSMEEGCCRYKIPDVFTYQEWNKMFDEWQNRLMLQYSVSGLLIGRFSIHE